MKSSVFVPSHITCFFTVFNHNNPLMKGSCGAGILLDKGIKTIAKPYKNDEIAIKINNNQDVFKEVISRRAAEYMKNKFDINEGIAINHDFDLPIGCGFGTSAASALGTVLSIDNLFELRIDSTELYQIAHLLELELSSGLGDVIAETSKGIVIRTKPGAPGFGKTINYMDIPNIPNGNDLSDVYVVTKTLSEIDTASIIQNQEMINKINYYGSKAMNLFLKDPNLDNLLKSSFNFAKGTGLLNKDMDNIINILKEKAIGSSMAMLGNTAFALTYFPEYYINDLCYIDDLIISKVNTSGIKFI
ncbi:pantoate kinase [Methanobrevibacter filiformis]|uniref:Pantoate kinase n=1 Tax=Methanobrevibacter filiformis TaxID=55758 RepID=A0A166D2D3_9EURY|nr:pantoate kinase [Methanobrevibacter filiformis]KZX15134.1 homoserine kinase [Methanobrevibacter filiformis]